MIVSRIAVQNEDMRSIGSFVPDLTAQLVWQATEADKGGKIDSEVQART